MKKEKTGYAQAMQQFLAVKPQPLKKSGYYPSRDELHEQSIGKLSIINPFLVDFDILNRGK